VPSSNLGKLTPHSAPERRPDDVTETVSACRRFPETCLILRIHSEPNRTVCSRTSICNHPWRLWPLKGPPRCFSSARGSRAEERLEKKAGEVSPDPTYSARDLQPPHPDAVRFRQSATGIPHANRVRRQSPASRIRGRRPHGSARAVVACHAPHGGLIRTPRKRVRFLHVFGCTGPSHDISCDHSF